MKKKLIALSGLVLGLAPFAAFAQTTGGTVAFSCAVSSVTGSGTQIQDLLCKIDSILNSILPVLIALGVVYFVWGVITYVISSDEEAKTAGRDRIIYGIIGLAVIIGVWGLVKILGNTFGINNNVQNINLPTTPY
jgi:Type IV secretion system pilin